MAGMRGGISPRQMQQAMKKMGITNEVISGLNKAYKSVPAAKKK